jgi:hypothetical protein
MDQSHLTGYVGFVLLYNADMDDDIIQAPTKGQPAPKPEKQDHLRVLANGAVYDMRRKRIVNSKNVTTKITEENAIEYQSRRVELKRAAVARGANAVANQGGSVEGGRLFDADLAYVEAIGEAMTMKALSVNDPKAVDAARFIFTETGIGERQAEPFGGNPDLVVAQALGALFIEYIKARTADNPQIVDVESDYDE